MQNTAHLTPGQQVRVTATDLTLAPAGTVTTIADDLGESVLAIRVGASAIVIDPTDVEAI